MKSENGWNPLSNRLQTHGSVVDFMTDSEDPFLSGSGIEGFSGKKDSKCCGSLVYSGGSVIPPPPTKKAVIVSPAYRKALDVYADMKAQYSAWDGTHTNRGAWWGTAGPGKKAGAKSVPRDMVTELQKICSSTSWKYSDSWSGGVSFHKSSPGRSDFIYHMLPPS